MDQETKESYRLNLNSYCGLIFDWPEEDIPRNLCKEINRVGSLELWAYQSFVNHEHPCLRNDGTFPDEMDVVEVWSESFKQFLDCQFVVEVTPIDRVTWFQRTVNSPYEDEPEWEDFRPPFWVDANEFLSSFALEPKELSHKLKILETIDTKFGSHQVRSGIEGLCEECGSEGPFSEPAIHPRHRGVRTMTCLGCKGELIHSTKVTRYLFGDGSPLGTR